MEPCDKALFCPVEQFLEHYHGPSPVQHDDVEECKHFLVEHNLLEQQPANVFRWRNAVADGDQCTDATRTYFHDLQLIVTKIFEHATGKGKRSEALGYDFIQSNTSGAAHKTGPKSPFHFVVTQRRTKYQSIEEFETAVSWQPFNECHNILSRDAHRMFLLAVTVDDTRMGLCYCSHSDFVKVPPFDWIESVCRLSFKRISWHANERLVTGEYRYFVRIFLGFAYAAPAMLGFDTTINLAPDYSLDKPGSSANGQHFIYRCPVDEEAAGGNTTPKEPKFKYFRTVKAINDLRHYDSSGRKTRIWAVVEVTGPNTNEAITGERLILKDVWLDTTRKTEAENMDMIFEDIASLVAKSNETWGDDWQARLVAEDPRFSELDDKTKKRLQYFLSDDNYKSLFLTKLHVWKGAESKKPLGCCSEQCRPGQEKPNQFPKLQWRFIYKEVCQNLDTLGTLGNAMDVLNQALDALQILFCANWVHRDISANNILAFNDNDVWKVKLADLEFSERFGYNLKRADSCIGTPYFMPYEIMETEYLLNSYRDEEEPRYSMAAQLGLQSGTAEYELYKTFTQFRASATNVPATATAEIPAKKDVVWYNYQHDLESIWWIVLYFITALVDHPGSQLYSKKVFKSKMTMDHERSDAFVLKFKTQVHDELHPALAGPFTSFMEKLRSGMLEEYLTRELFGQLKVHESYGYIHFLFATQFRGFLEKNEGNWKETPIAPKGIFIKRAKRPLEHEDKDERPVSTMATGPRDPNKKLRVAIGTD